MGLGYFFWLLDMQPQTQFSHLYNGSKSSYSQYSWMFPTQLWRPFLIGLLVLFPSLYSGYGQLERGKCMWSLNNTVSACQSLQLDSSVDSLCDHDQANILLSSWTFSHLKRLVMPCGRFEAHHSPTCFVILLVCRIHRPDLAFDSFIALKLVLGWNLKSIKTCWMNQMR